MAAGPPLVVTALVAANVVLVAALAWVTSPRARSGGPAALRRALGEGPLPDAPLRVFYHIYAADGRIWEATVGEQLRRMQDSGLYAAAAGVHCFIAGPQGDEAKAFVEGFGSKVKVEKVAKDDTSFERITLLGLRRVVGPKDRFLYLHSKGIKQMMQGNTAQLAAIIDWRRFMEYYLIARWRDCVRFLDRYDAVGVNVKATPFKHFSGNFWWSKASYYMRLPDHIGPEYLDPEKYLLSGGGRALCITSSGGVNHYDDAHPPSKYVDRPVKEGDECKE